MEKELKYKIKINRSFNSQTETEDVRYFVTQKIGRWWWYELDEEAFGKFMSATFLINLILSVIILAIVEKKMQHNDILTFLNVVWCMLGGFFLWGGLGRLMNHREFESKEKALEFIKNAIHKSNLPSYNTSEDITITYKEGKIEMER